MPQHIHPRVWPFSLMSKPNMPIPVERAGGNLLLGHQGLIPPSYPSPKLDSGPGFSLGVFSYFEAVPTERIEAVFRNIP